MSGEVELVWDLFNPSDVRLGQEATTSAQYLVLGP